LIVEDEKEAMEAISLLKKGLGVGEVSSLLG